VVIRSVVRGLTDFLITLHIVKGFCGRGPALVGLFLAVSIPVGGLVVFIGEAYPGGFTAFTGKVVRTLLRGLH
jgi:hypothetical protein